MRCRQVKVNRRRPDMDCTLEAGHTTPHLSTAGIAWRHPEAPYGTRKPPGKNGARSPRGHKNSWLSAKPASGTAGAEKQVMEFRRVGSIIQGRIPPNAWRDKQWECAT